MKRYNEDTKRFNEIAKQKSKCEHCGHTQLMGFKDRAICSWCKNYIYKNDRVKFIYKMKEVKNGFSK